LAHDVDRIGLELTPLVINACWPDRPGLSLSVTAAARDSDITLPAAVRSALVSSSRFGAARLDVQREQIARLGAALPGSHVVLPRLATPRLGPEDLELLADALEFSPVFA
jgi:hypothetical protein